MSEEVLRVLPGQHSVRRELQMHRL
jgi:hypothetical protein